MPFPTRIRVWGAFLGMMMVAAAVGTAAATDPRREVRETFVDYREALLEKQGDIAGFLVTPETLAFYDYARLAALKAEPEVLERLPLMQQLLALRLRHEVPLESLRTLSAERLIQLAVEQGLLSAEGLRNMDLGPVKVDGDVAVAEQLDGFGRRVGVTWRFERVDGIWRVDLRPTITAGDAVLEAMLQKMGRSRRELMETLVERSSGQQVGAALWQPPGQAD